MRESDTKKQEQYALIDAEFACEHVTCELRRRVIKGGSITYVRQCVRCGQTTSPVKAEIALAEVGDIVMPAFDTTLERAWNAQRSARYKQVFDSLSGKRSEEYEEYLDSEDWQAKRELVFERSGGICEGCRERKADEVHHLTYAHIGKEFLWELVAICGVCHERIHENDEADD